MRGSRSEEAPDVVNRDMNQPGEYTTRTIEISGFEGDQRLGCERKQLVTHLVSAGTVSAGNTADPCTASVDRPSAFNLSTFAVNLLTDLTS